ncbi:ferredoxin [Kitasatospora sp. NPDC057542]|uniref:ferredoxin n=1 Tax=Streptomycetaceae TaxID=2062 RepID=UPI001CCD52DA|nr:ferredoxin [Streptomyces sp. LS1784]
MRLVVDLNRCQGYAQCAFLAPDVFTMHGDEALMFDPQPDDRQWQAVLRAAEACPVKAITVEGPGGVPAGEKAGASGVA